MHARGLTSAQVLAALSAQAGVAADTPADLLREMGGRRLTVAIDAVDEALDPADLVAGVLRPLVEAGPAAGLRLLVGTRPHLVGSLGLTGSGSVIDLDSERYADPDSIYQYVLRGLESGGAPYAAAGPDLTAEIARAVADAAGQLLPGGADRDSDAAQPAGAARSGQLPVAGEPARDRPPTRCTPISRRALARPPSAPATCCVRSPSRPRGLPWESISGCPGVHAQRALLHGRGPHLAAEARPWYVVEAIGVRRSVYRLYHAALAEYLRQGRDEAGVHGAFTAFLFSRVPAAARGLDSGRAHPYARAHLATHAQRAGTGQLDHLLCDPGYLINAASPRACSRRCPPRGPRRQSAQAWPTSERSTSSGASRRSSAPPTWSSRRGSPALPKLAAQVDARFPQRVWSIPWTHCASGIPAPRPRRASRRPQRRPGREARSRASTS